MKQNLRFFFIPAIIFLGSLFFLGYQYFIPSKITRLQPKPAATIPQKQHTLNSIPIDHSREIVVGQSGNFSGSADIYAECIKTGIETYFNFINAQGGVNGKNIRLESLNDSGDPQKTEDNVLALMKRGIKVFIGNMGTRNVLKLLPLIKREEITLLFPWGGNEELRNQSLRNLISGPGLIAPQIKKLIEYINENVRHHSIAVYYSDDALSRTAFQETLKILESINIKPIATSYFNRLTLNIATSAQPLLAAAPKVVLCLGTSIPTTKLINYFFEHGAYTTSFFGIDSTFLVPQILAGKGVNFYYSSAVPAPKQSTLPVAHEYLKNLAHFFPHSEPNILSFTYYLCAAILVAALQKAGTIDGIIEHIEAMHNFDIGGFDVTFDKTNRHAFGSRITIIKE